jgi:hypothetical protein
VGGRAEAFFSDRVVSFDGERGIQGKVELAEALGTTGVVEERREENWWERVVGKSGGGRRRLYTWQRVGLADEASSRDR